MASITSWVRLEPRARDADLIPGVEARLHDPLWLLARQWQLGELSGTDAGSPIFARARADAMPLEAVRGNDGPWMPIAPATTPLAATALAPARDEPATHPALGRRARGGRHLLRLVAAAGSPADVAVFLTKFALAVDPATRASLDDADRRFVDVMMGRTADGDMAEATLAPLLPDDSTPLPDGFGVALANVVAVSRACRQWLAWYATFARRSRSPAWQPDQLAYQFDARATSSTGGIVLSATHHRSDSVRWYDVDAGPATGDDGSGAGAVSSIVSTTMPVRARYRGMPARRYWELEDAAVHWPSIDAGPGDIARILFVEFGLTFADHWLVVPLEVAAGSLVRVASLVVTDTFGVRTLVHAAPDLDVKAERTGWSFLELSRRGDVPGPLVFLPPAASELGGPTLDAIDFARDDVSDVLWAIDRQLLGADGRPRDIAPPAQPVPVPRPPDAPALAYRVGPQVPLADHIFRRRDSAPGPRFELATIPGTPPAERPELPAQLSPTALPARPTRLAVVPVTWRAADGGYHVVATRVTTPATATPALPALAFDQLEERR